ncbi:hypothetical protein V1478_002185 [Vespula squamosa]|uniref:Uncharacterized protein n=1 Tax=Vespula squamosa TaxID=30214 RepID=A0ABD2BWB6_VESSQ
MHNVTPIEWWKNQRIFFHQTLPNLLRKKQKLLPELLSKILNGFYSTKSFYDNWSICTNRPSGSYSYSYSYSITLVEYHTSFSENHLHKRCFLEDFRIMGKSCVG